MGQQCFLLTRPSTFQKYLRQKGNILCFEASQSNQNILLNTFTYIKMHHRIHQKTIIILIKTFSFNLCYKCCLGDVLLEVLDRYSPVLIALEIWGILYSPYSQCN